MHKNYQQLYLAKYAEPESLSPELASLDLADAVLVIPAYRETADFLVRLVKQPFLEVNDLLVVVVSNHPAGLPDEEVGEAIAHHRRLLERLPPADWSTEQLSYHASPRVSSLVVHRIAEKALNPKQSVGLARKLGADIALALIASGQIRLPWIFNTDADAYLSQDYFSSTAVADNKALGIIYPYKHVGAEGAVLSATRLYEQRLKHYVEGLSHAGSPYAFQTLGSTIAVSADGYAAVRGFPRRAAGEDFYLINKLAKIGKVETLATPVIEIEARCSDRIPFGTGPSVRKLVESIAPETEPIFYNPEVFEVLRCFISNYANALEPGQQAGAILQQDKYVQELVHARTNIGFERFVRHAQKMQLENRAYTDHFHLWFDGFRTLKFVHFLRDNYFPNLSFEQLKDGGRPPSELNEAIEIA